MCSAWLTATSVDWLYDIAGLTGMAIMAAGLLIVPSGGSRARPVRRSWGQLALIGSLVLLGLLAASVGRQYVATRYAQAGAAQVTRSPQKAISPLRRPARLDPDAPTTHSAVPSAYARPHDYAGPPATRP